MDLQLPGAFMWHVVNLVILSFICMVAHFALSAVPLYFIFSCLIQRLRRIIQQQEKQMSKCLFFRHFQLLASRN